ncbi:hypothetical protein MKK67_12320 [Methylobacterium sp. J-072]|uniref:LPO_1073/Vpar_1526 family protein n=1 Tax=Methylobacterium sp. J-072 TaxID=2836651 RepID=UPI001FB87BF3|nr:LPO_1073/Vpar_1526 family protein [Methylobacterium sp. J-072]MCJ2093268.1 hypothetical protein [Methylobacterium sp. J-072]
MTDQKQSVGIGGEAYQAGHNLTVNQGVSADQMADIMMAVAARLQQYVLRAEVKFLERCEEIRSELLKEFTRPGTHANPEAFQDPDFQFALRGAHESYGRVGTPELLENLVRLISERSSRATSSRVANLLNQAINISANLSRDEYATLSALFTMSCIHFDFDDKSKIIMAFKKITAIFTNNLLNVGQSIEYLSSIGCITFPNTFASDFWNIVYQNYACAFAASIQDVELKSIFPDGLPPEIAIILIDHRRSSGGETFLNGPTQQNVHHLVYSLRCTNTEKQKLRDLHAHKLPERSVLISLFSQDAPHLEKLQQIHDSTMLMGAFLSSLGKILAHSALFQHFEDKAPLEKWVN